MRRMRTDFYNKKSIRIFLYLAIFSFNFADLLYTTSSRIQCEYRDRNGESLILNCTLVSGSQQQQQQQQSNSNELNAPPSSSIPVEANQNVGSSVSASSTISLKVGMERVWRTPWESLSINHNIIRTLIWSNSRLAELGDYAFKDLNFLQKIDLSNNKLQYIQINAFKQFELDIVDVDLSQNQFSFVPEKIFLNRQMRNLEIFRMNENPIQIIAQSNFDMLRNLKLLELNYCQIKLVEENAFENLRSLESLSLIGNHLRQLNEITFRPFSLRSFYVHENPLNCDCNLRWLLDYIKNVDYQQQIYDAQLTLSHPSLSWPGLSKSALQRHRIVGVAQAAHDYLKCDQPNSLKSKPSFLDINPDSFMCDIRLEFGDNVNESFYELGDDALLICNVYGDPEPDVYWSFGNRPIEKALSDDENKYVLSEMYTIKKTNKSSELRIRNLDLNDFGSYYCTAEIRGSNNRKSIQFSLRKLNQIIGAKNALTSLSNLYDIIVTSIEESLVYVSNNLLNNKNVSNTTLLILFSIFISLSILLMFLCLFACWKFNCCCCCYATSIKRNRKAKLFDLARDDEESISTSSKLLVQAKSADNTDHYTQQNNNYAGLAYDSSATVVSNHQKMSNSIRMAYPNLNQDIYANHSLLTTTSSTTASYLPNNSQQIAIDTSNQTPKFRLLSTSNHNQHDTYYDDLKCRGDLNNEIYSSPYRIAAQGQCQASFSPSMRRGDPTVPLYATLKPKAHSQKTQNYASYYTTMGRSNNATTPPPLPAQKKYNQSNNYLLNLPPPPPPPPQMPPLKPKRTFEYSANRDLYSDSGALLLNSNSSEASSTPSEYESQLATSSQPLIAVNPKINQIKTQFKPKNGSSSTTSLEEDLDLNDLKDFEDVTFDNLSKPNEHLTSSLNTFRKLKTKQSLMNKLMMQNGSDKNNKQINNNNNNNINNINNNNNNSSDQSLLLKSSSSSEKSSSDNTINDISNDINQKKDDLLIVEQEAKEKIYEETEI